MRASPAVGLVTVWIAMGAPALAGAEVQKPSPARTQQSLTPREAGARYGQALGSEHICFGLLRTTDAVARLAEKYSGADRKAFKDEADKIFNAWRDACRQSGGPNQCRLVHEWNCRAALREIGPEGSALAGLVEQKKQ